MASPQEPDDEPAGDEFGEEIPPAAPDDVSAEDAIWRAIVDNYGERPDIDEPEIAVPPSPRDLDQPRLPGGEAPVGSTSEAAEPPEVHPEEHYVPPDPPPLPMPPPARLLAWLGLFGVPAFVLIALIVGIAVPGWGGLLLMVWFIGGFVFLVASMGPGPGHDHDDGARL